jgi:YD repeat-containing protein
MIAFINHVNFTRFGIRDTDIEPACWLDPEMLPTLRAVRRCGWLDEVEEIRRREDGGERRFDGLVERFSGARLFVERETPVEFAGLERREAPEATVDYGYYMNNVCSRKAPNVVDTATWGKGKPWAAGSPGGFPGTADGLWPNGWPAVAPDGRRATFTYADVCSSATGVSVCAPMLATTTDFLGTVTQFTYDARGYLTRIETALLQERAAELAEALGPGALVEFGAGSARKVSPLLRALDGPAYVALDISAAHLRAACRDLQGRHPGVPVLGICCDYTSLKRLPVHPLLERRTRLGFFPGSSLGNFNRGEARGLLRDVLRLGRQNPREVSKLLNQSVSLPVVLVSRLLNTRIGEAVLERISAIVYPLNASRVGLQALRSAMDVMLERDPNVVIFGQDVGYFGGVFRCTEGLQAKYGKSRVFDAPISEGGIVGTAVGMGAYGLRPVVEIQFAAVAATNAAAARPIIAIARTSRFMPPAMSLRSSATASAPAKPNTIVAHRIAPLASSGGV